MILLEEFENQLKQAVFDINEEWRQMGVADLKDRLRKVVGIHTLTIQPGAVRINNQTIPIGPAATDDEIAAAIQANINKINDLSKPTAAKPMSITGLQSGAFQAKLAEMKKRFADKQNEGLARVDTAVEAGNAKIDQAVAGVEAKMNKEIEDSLQEFAQFTNGGPA